MKTTVVRLAVPEAMVPYLDMRDGDLAFQTGAMLLYPLICDLTISHGRAAEVLGVHKTDLIEFHDSLGIPYLDQSDEELAADLATLESLAVRTQ